MNNGVVIDETNVQGGWKDFSLKQKVNEIQLLDKAIGPSIFGMSMQNFAGFAVHWIGEFVIGGALNPHVRREVMMVRECGRVDVWSLNLITSEWEIYTENLKAPKRPHLFNYNLETHGIKI